MEKATVDVEASPPTELATSPKLSQIANQDDPKTDYSSKAKNKTKFSDYAVGYHRPSPQFTRELTENSANLYLLYFD